MKIQKIKNAISTYWHRFSLKRKGVNVGCNSRFCGSIVFQLSNPANVSIGNNVVITGGCNINPLGVRRGSQIKTYFDANLSIGDYCGLSDVSIVARKGITIGNYVTIGAGTIINDSNAHCINYYERRKEKGIKDRSKLPIIHKPICIEDDVFIGAYSIITKGVTIGARSIIATGSVVVCDIPSDEVWGGNPAKYIKSL